MKLKNDFEVPVGIDRAWEVLLDVEQVAPCLPGAKITGQEGDDYQGMMKLKIGPITSTYKGTVKIVEADEAAHKAVMRAQAKDARGQGTAAATITSTMESAGEGTKVEVETDMRVTGPAAQFGRGVMQDISAKLMGQFADCLAKRMGGEDEDGTPEAAAPAAAAAAGNGGAAPAAAGSAPSSAGGGEEEEAAAATTGTSPAAPDAAAPGPAPAGPPPQQAESEDVLDLGAASRDAVLKRLVPVFAGVVAVLVVLRLIRRK